MLKIAQEGCPPLKIDVTEPGQLLVWQDGKHESNVVILARNQLLALGRLFIKMATDEKTDH